LRHASADVPSSASRSASPLHYQRSLSRTQPHLPLKPKILTPAAHNAFPPARSGVSSPLTPLSPAAIRPASETPSPVPYMPSAARDFFPPFKFAFWKDPCDNANHVPPPIQFALREDTGSSGLRVGSASPSQGADSCICPSNTDLSSQIQSLAQGQNEFRQELGQISTVVRSTRSDIQELRVQALQQRAPPFSQQSLSTQDDPRQHLRQEHQPAISVISRQPQLTAPPPEPVSPQFRQRSSPFPAPREALTDGHAGRPCSGALRNLGYTSENETVGNMVHSSIHRFSEL